jgi:hypothetical protein
MTKGGMRSTGTLVCRPPARSTNAWRAGAGGLLLVMACSGCVPMYVRYNPEPPPALPTMGWVTYPNGTMDQFVVFP